MNTLELARLQFGVTTIFHFIFVPMSIGLAAWVAYCQTRWYRSKDEVYLRMTRFWGKFMLITLAIGVVTGIVQEFQFGMNWSEYSRYVGDIFGAPLAMEGLMAFFLESTFVGLWIFGWDRLSPRVHLATIWLTSFGTILSAYFILAANSWMQHPVGYVINHAAHKAELKSIWAVLTNSTLLLAFPHTIFGAMCTGAMIVLGISAFGLLRGRSNQVYRRSARQALPFALAAAILTGAFGHGQGMLMEKQQPMKMAAAEALYKTTKGASLSIFAVGPFEHFPKRLNTDIRIPHLLSILGTASWDGEVKGVDQLQAEDVKKYGPGDYVPILGVTYWTFRLMAGVGVALLVLPLIGLWLLRRGVFERKRWFLRAAVVGAFLPPLANLTGWIFTEMGRQPWVVYGLLKTSDARSPLVSSTDIVLSLVGYTALYGVLLAIGGKLFKKEIAHGPEAEPTGEPKAPGDGAPRPELILAY
ncbi:MAG TPA: cytochrome ubiquinol oxidase subunit I [Solirubrobacteraceae bacterium]|nr:cytochrome ubiquinol oxidase subunit I [Solirubrobacteraceae bacterium]HTW40959.1 cytochrome ubiquinol oxidase subunit I [Solirubrobacteraceae bacterium]